MTLENVNDIENYTCKSENNMKMTLIKVKKSKINSHKHKIDTHESKGVQK